MKTCFFDVFYQWLWKYASPRIDMLISLRLDQTQMALNLTVRVKAAINKDIISLDKDLSVKSAIKLMVRKDIGSVVVTEEESDKPVGIVTERDILKSIAYGKTRPETKIEGIMSKPLITIEADATIGEAAEMMLKKKIRRLLVKQNDKYIGIITQRDLQRLMIDTFRSLLIT
ncbi:MAG: CBS domain-containing protein [Nitrososphaeraceae archaeon]